MDTLAWVTTAAAAAAGLAAGGPVVATIAWVPGTAPGHRLPPAQCPHGTARLRAADLIPVSGWRGLAGRCAECPAPGAWPVAAGLLTAVVFVVMAEVFGPSPVLPAFCYLGAVGVALTFIDARHHRLPDVLTLPSYPVGLVLLGAAALGSPQGTRHLLGAAIGMAAAWLAFVLQVFIYPAGIGWGDVKLSGILGLYLGWLGARPLVAGLFLGYVLAAIAGIALLAAGRASRKSPIPFGPFLLAGTLAAIIVSGLAGPLG
jgi:leader peptidase (prepilin peptidase)/N-methyltransferase